EVLAIFFVLPSKFLAQGWFFVQDDEEVHPNGNCRNSGDQSVIGMCKDDPQPDPARGETDIHRIANVTIEADYDQALRWSNGRWCTASCPAEVPDATERD